MKKIRVLFLFLIFNIWILQTNAQSSFVQDQRTILKVEQIFKQKIDTLKKQFNAAKINFPPKQIYLRSFKYDSEIELWVRESVKDSFKLFKTYRVCALSGSLGPKRMEGDFQVPEGFYHINQLNPKSTYHLSLGVNYPNSSDEILSDTLKPGSDIYIHGGCVTVGCIPIKDYQIEEVYLLCSFAKENGQDFIPLHIFPIRYNITNSYRYLALNIKDNKEYQEFVLTLQEVYDYFNIHKKIPIITVDAHGKYHTEK